MDFSGNCHVVEIEHQQNCRNEGKVVRRKKEKAGSRIRENAESAQGIDAVNNTKNIPEKVKKPIFGKKTKTRKK